jgi:signal transduction histidine kinase
MIRQMVRRGVPPTWPRVAVLWVATAIVGIAGAVLTVIVWGDLAPADSYTTFGAAVAGIVYATLGALVVRRVSNRIGWILLLEGLGMALMCLTSSYAILGVLTHPGALPAAKLIGAASEWIFVPVAIGIGLILLLFPTGSIPSPRWRVVVWIGAVATALALLSAVLVPRTVALPAPGGVSLTFRNPVGVPGLDVVPLSWLASAVAGISVLVVLSFALALVALVIRYRRGGPELRQQIKWVAFTAVTALILQVVSLIAQATCGCDASIVSLIAGVATGLVVLFGIPAAITIAILKHGLYEIDVIINRAVVYGLLAAALTAVYVTVVVGVGALVGYAGGGVSPTTTLFAAAAVALLFQPLRHQAQRVANRFVYGERATPYKVLSDFAESMAGTLSFDELLGRMVSVLAAGSGATRVDVWLRIGSELRPVATWPADAPAAGVLTLHSGDLPSIERATRALPVRQGDELLGALSLQKPRNEPLSVTEDKLLQDFASQAGLVLRNVRLTAELQAKIVELQSSRRRLVEAQDAERRKIERNLHDGAQQHLVGLKVQLGLLERVADDPSRVRVLAEQVQSAAQAALDELRDLARGIYPPLLADQGLAAALGAQARKTAVPTRVDSDGIGRYPQEIEAAVYFCALEALQNVAKYAHARSAILRLGEREGFLVFEIEDDGRGFDADVATRGSGLQGMEDRLEAIGGRFELVSQLGHGTRVRGVIPLQELSH